MTKQQRQMREIMGKWLKLLITEFPQAIINTDREKQLCQVLSVASGDILKKHAFANEAQTTTQHLKNPEPNNEQNLSKPDIESALILTNANIPDSRLLRAKVLKAAMQVCDLWGDGEAARQAMRADIEAVPDEQLPELLAHFDHAYSAFKGLSDEELKKLSKLILG